MLPPYVRTLLTAEKSHIESRRGRCADAEMEVAGAEFIAPNSPWDPTSNPTRLDWMDALDLEELTGMMADPGYVVIREAISRELVEEASATMNDKLPPRKTTETYLEYEVPQVARTIFSTFSQVRSTAQHKILANSRRGTRMS
jgi:hypothetical protein